MELIHQSEFRIDVFQIGPRGVVRPTAIMSFLEQAAGEHASLWKLAVPDLMPRGLTWVITRYHLKLLKQPSWNDRLTVTTWPSGRSNVFATRDFEVSAADGTPIAQATSAWVVLDLETKRPVPVTEVVPPEFALERRTLNGFSALPRLTAPTSQLELPVMLRDLDVNDHVNHTVYVQWALEAVAPALQRTERLREIEVTYRAEALQGDRVSSALEEAPGEPGTTVFHHRISRDGTELARLRTVWGR